MKTLCFALLLSQNSIPENSPPKHIQELLKKRILYQIKQQLPDKQFNFDEPTCDVIGSYDYANDAVRISSTDQNTQIELPYVDILNGKKLELSEITQSIETRENIIAAASTQKLLDPSYQHSPPTSQSGIKKWVPWIIVGAIGLSLGGYAIYNSMERRSGNSNEGSPAKRPR
ncbi:MAG: hypothetical protein R3A80_00800 [Bdellovibrionota bacterium]